MKAILKAESAQAADRSADFQSAVSRICNLPGVVMRGAPSCFERLAECNSAIQQIKNLRYFGPGNGSVIERRRR
jgi:hypothetical protein